MQIVKLKNGILSYLLIGVSIISTSAFAININEKQKEINFLTIEAPICGSESEYIPALPENLKAELYYQAAMKILGQNDTDHYQHMYTLANKAAEMGHWKAMLLMANLYLRNNDSQYVEYNPEKAKAYIDDLLKLNVPAAYYAMGQFKLNGVEVFRGVPVPASVFIFEAAKLNNPDALSDVYDIFMSLGRKEEARVLLECAVQQQQGIAGALLKKANMLEAEAATESELAESFKYLYLATKAGNYNALVSFANKENYYKQQYGKEFFGRDFLERMSVVQKSKNSAYFHRDPYRKAQGINADVKGNSNLVFPFLERVVPFPPADLPEWDKDIGNILSEEDLKIYRTDFDYDQLVKEAEALMVQSIEPSTNEQKNSLK